MNNVMKKVHEDKENEVFSNFDFTISRSKEHNMLVIPKDRNKQPYLKTFLGLNATFIVHITRQQAETIIAGEEHIFINV